MFDVKKIENAKIEVTCKIEGEEWKVELKKAFKKLASNVQIKGFRKGQAPESVLKKHISDEQVRFEAAQMIAQDQITAAIKEKDLTLIDRPSLINVKPEENDCTLVFECPVYPDVTIKDYKKLGYKVEDVSVSDGEIDAELDRIKQNKAEIEIKEDGSLEKGDIAVFDFEGFKDGVAFDGGKGENYELEIGSGQFIPGFEDQMIGMKSNEEKQLNVTFPEDYHVENLKGAPVVFNVKLHEIKKKTLAEIDDELVKELKIDNVNNVDELKEYIKNNLLENKKIGAENKAVEDVLNKLVDNTEVDIPSIMITSEQDQLFSEYSQRLMSQGITIDQFAKITKKSVDDIKNELKPDAIKRVKTTLALNKIAELENVTVDQKDIDEEIEKMAKQYNMPVDQIKKYIPEDSVKSDLRLQKALEFIKH